MMLCVCVRTHRLLYVCGVEQYVSVEVERHGNVKQELMGSLCLHLWSVHSFS